MGIFFCVLFKYILLKSNINDYICLTKLTQTRNNGGKMYHIPKTLSVSFFIQHLHVSLMIV